MFLLGHFIINDQNLLALEPSLPPMHWVHNLRAPQIQIDLAQGDLFYVTKRREACLHKA